MLFYAYTLFIFRMYPGEHDLLVCTVREFVYAVYFYAVSFYQSVVFRTVVDPGDFIQGQKARAVSNVWAD